MPTHSKSVSSISKPKLESQILPWEEENQTAPPEIELFSKPTKKSKKNAQGKRQLNIDTEEKLGDDLAEVRATVVGSPTKPQSILNQLPSAFPRRSESPSSDAQEVTNGIQKISDEHTPPTERWSQHAAYDRVPSTEAVSKPNLAGSPPVFHATPIGTGGFNHRIPMASPPQRKARPVSYGGLPPLPTHVRKPSSPYAFPAGAYGSPPALPHLPQPHFYSAPDVDLGVTGHRPSVGVQEPTFYKFARFSNRSRNEPLGIITALDGNLAFFSYPGDKVEQIECIDIPSALILDAEILTGRGKDDSLAELQPLVAVVSHRPRDSTPLTNSGREDAAVQTDHPSSFVPFPFDSDVDFETVVAIYSLTSKSHVQTLLRIPAPNAPSQYQGSATPSVNPVGQIKLHVSGRFLIASSGTSGEIFVFGMQMLEETPSFCCIGKFWTSIQPRLQRRDSSHSRSTDIDVSPADLGRGITANERPILSINGRWLAFCPPSSTSRPSINAVLGEGVVGSRFTGIESTSVPTRPSVNCEVESPDAETFLGKVAKGVAQEVLRSTKWLGEKGMQTWQSYWKKEPNPSSTGVVGGYTSPVAHPSVPYGVFPPTHGTDIVTSAKDHELVCIVDLEVLTDRQDRRASDQSHILATFQPPRGCSFLSFMPGGLNLMTAAKDADVQYVWDLIQCKYRRPTLSATDIDSVRQSRCVRQVARYERVSPTNIIDVAWESPLGGRLAMLTHNRTVHLFDLPSAAVKWPPPRTSKTIRPTSAPNEALTATQSHEPPPPGGFLASAMNIAGKTQPILANLRGRAPSMGAGLSNIGVNGLGFASATGAKGSKAVATGLSKSLGAASETVTSIRHAGQSRLSLKHQAGPGCLFWNHRGDRSVLSVLDPSAVRDYYVRKTKPREHSSRETVSVFDARRAVSTKISRGVVSIPDAAGNDSGQIQDYWHTRRLQSNVVVPASHPLAHAEIETSAPYQPFHSDTRVTLSVFQDSGALAEIGLQTASETLTPQQRPQPKSDQWVFGSRIATTRLALATAQADEAGQHDSVIYRETSLVAGAGDQVVSTTRRRKHRKNQNSATQEEDASDEEGFFEDDCDVLDFAADRV